MASRLMEHALRSASVALCALAASKAFSHGWLSSSCSSVVSSATLPVSLVNNTWPETHATMKA
eukprot:215716-Pleurochrysis_carterae.AAC.1